MDSFPDIGLVDGMPGSTRQKLKHVIPIHRPYGVDAQMPPKLIRGNGLRYLVFCV